MNTEYEEAWENLMQESRFAWWEWDVQNNTVTHNSLKASMLGYDPEDFKGRGYQVFTDLIHPDDHEEAMQAMRIVLQGKTKLYNSEYRILNRNGDYLWFLDRGIITGTDEEGKPIKIRGIVIDLGKESERGTDVDALLAVYRESAKTEYGDVSFITLCSSCSRVKRETREWVNLPEDLTSMISEKISHGICPQCLHALYPEIAGQVLQVVEEENW